MEMPESLEEHQVKFKEGAWKNYDLNEFGWFVHLFCKRANHRKDLSKAEKDLTDEQNYLDMMQSKIDSLKSEILP